MWQLCGVYLLWFTFSFIFLFSKNAGGANESAAHRGNDEYVGFFMPYLLPEVVIGISFSGMFNTKASSEWLNGSLDSELHISLFPKHCSIPATHVMDVCRILEGSWLGLGKKTSWLSLGKHHGLGWCHNVSDLVKITHSWLLLSHKCHPTYILTLIQHIRSSLGATAILRDFLDFLLCNCSNHSGH